MSIELAYAAGLIDGEGYVAVGVQKSKAGNDVAKPTISVSMTDFEPILFLRKTFDIGAVQNLRPRQPHHLPQMRWSVCSQQALFVSKLILPYSINKKPKLQSIIDWYNR